MKRLSVIIPTFNEALIIGQLIAQLKKNVSDPLTEIIVVDGGSTDRTRGIAKINGAKVIASPVKGRAYQMNLGAEMASGEILFFLHADSLPPPQFDEKIRLVINSKKLWGSFRIRFDYQHWLLNIVAWLTRFNCTLFRFGDQGLFVTNKLFVDAGKFSMDRVIFEDTEMARRLRIQSKGIKISKATITTSARKFRVNGAFKLTAIFLSIYGCSIFLDSLIKNCLLSIRQGLFKIRFK